MKNQKHILLGIVLITLSAAIYTLESFLELDLNEGFIGGIFFIHYIPAIVYLVVIWFSEGKFWRLFQKDNFTSHTILLVLFNISAYSLNRSIPVFNESTDWLVIFLVIENTLLLGYALVNNASRIFQVALCFFMTICLFFNVYQILMILPTAPIGIIASPFIGISLLLFIPIFYVICIVTLLRNLSWTITHKVAAGAGLLVTLITVSTFCIKWHSAESAILASKLVEDAPFANDQGLPDWVSIAQVVENTPLTEKYLKTGLVYQKFANYEIDEFSSIWNSPFDEKFVHDPLIAIASIFTKDHALSESTKIKILNYLYDSRHQTSDRFWSGENLKSKQVVTNVELFPQERLSFTEQIITIENNRVSKSRWRSQQEALYTFDLSEGGVVTSLSLWIEGQESKAILTSKNKAEKAYNTIVGREMRDPSVVYWMEGNKIRVRVFPCTPKEERKFKIGITAPLTIDGENLKYQAIGFKGPDYSKAMAAINIVPNESYIVQSTINLEESPLYHSWQGDYVRNWNLTIRKPKVKANSFSFHDEHYQVEETTSQKRKIDVKSVYLDVSNIWTKDELKAVSKLIESKKAYVFTTHMDRKASSNSILKMADSSLPSFTLFPFHQADLNDAIVITKGGNATPNLSDLKNTPFKKQLFKHIKNQYNPPLVLDIGTQPSDYMKSLKEFGVIDHQSLDLSDLTTCFNTLEFPTKNVDSKLRVIPQNGLTIRRTDVPMAHSNQASDHLMRLFYYQEVMHDIGSKYFTDDKNEYIEDYIVDKAATANIVTPLSSLIVLETQKDYDRFEIEKKTDSLGNASISNSGAVPEPHEWAMIILGIAFTFILCWKKRSSPISL